MSRSGFRFLRMLLPSGNSRVSVTLNRLIRALFRKGFSRGLFCGGSFRALFRKGFFLAFFRRGFFRALFRRAFSRALFRRGFFRALFRRAFSGRSFKLGVFTHRIVWMIWYVGCLLFEFFSIIARCVLDQFWGSPRWNQHIRDWINWNWNHQKKTRGVAPDKIMPKTNISI